MKKLKKILLINWLYFSKEVIEVGDVNFLTGKNGAGKSTVIDALQIVLLGETNARNFNLAANERSQRTLDGYLRADMDENNPYSRRGKDFSTYIVCEFEDDVEHNSFVCGVMFDCRSDGSKHDHFFIYVGKLPENCFVEAARRWIFTTCANSSSRISPAPRCTIPSGSTAAICSRGGTCTTSRCSA